jgi:hypothetical protein
MGAVSLVSLQKEPLGQGAGYVAAVRRKGQLLPMGHGMHASWRAALEQEVRSVVELMNVPEGQLQSTPVELMAYMLPSLDPTYRVPSGPSTGDENTWPPVAYFHFTPPVELMA